MNSKLQNMRDHLSEVLWDFYRESALEAATKVDLDTLFRQHLGSAQGQETLGFAVEEAISRRHFGPEFTEAAREALANGVLKDLRQELLGLLQEQLLERLDKARNDVMASEKWRRQIEEQVRRVYEEKSWCCWLKSLFMGG